MTPAAVLFDLGGVFLPFARERRVATIVRQLNVDADDVRELFDGPLPWRMDLGEADETDFAAAFAETGRFDDAVQSAEKAIELARAAGRQDLARRLTDELQRYKTGIPLHQ